MYDTIVIGSDLSSLIAAVTSASRGRSTVLLSRDDIPDIVTASGYSFNVDPMPLAGFGPNQTLSSFFSDHGMPCADDTSIHTLNPAFQMIFPDHRIELFYDSNELIGELEKELSLEGVDIRGIYSSMLKMSDIINTWIQENPRVTQTHYNRFVMLIRNFPEMLKLKWSLLTMVRIIRKNPSLKKVFDALINVLSYLDTSGNSFMPLMSPYILSLPHRGLYYPVGGKGLFMEMLRKGFSDAGGELKQYTSIKRMTTGDEIQVEMEACEPAIEISGKHLIISTKSEMFTQLLFDNKKFGRLQRHLKRVEKRYYPFTLHLGVLDKGIPEKMSPYTAIIVEEKINMMDTDIIHIETSMPGDIRRAPAGKRALSATVFLKDNPSRLSSPELEERSNTIIRQIETFLPFLRENLDYLNVEASIELSKKYQEVVNQKFQMKNYSFIGMASLPNRTPLKNVYITGGMLMAGLGFEGEIISGINAALLTIT
jgi:phytoene dehydrogenase-like protein